MDTSISFNSSLSSTNVGDYTILSDVSDFVPTSLLMGAMVLSSLMSKIHSKQLLISCPRLTFLLFPKTRALSGMFLYPNLVTVFLKSTPSLRKISLRSNLMPSRQISLLRGKHLPTKCSPLIKKRSHGLFVKLAFPSMIEVTTTNGRALLMFGLTSTSPLARMVFDKFVFKPQGSSSADPISPEDNSLLSPHHEYDTLNIRDDLWVNHGIDTFTIKEIGCTRNTVTNICRDVVRK
jgi:hypothetical protein